MALVCKICFESAQYSNQAKITVCGHVFCDDCASKWFETQNNCPVCRRPIAPSDNELISVYDQENGDQDQTGNFLETPSVFVPKLGSSVKIHDESANNLEREFLEDSTATSGRSSHDGFEEDVQVKFVLGKVVNRWQQIMIERAQIKSQVGLLKEKNLALMSELEGLREENAKLREQLDGGQGDLYSGNQQLDSLLKSDLKNARIGQPKPTKPKPEDKVLIERHTRGTDEVHPNRIRDFWMTLIERRSRVVHVPAEFQERISCDRWELETSLANHSEPVHGISVNGTSTLVATASWDHTCRVYDVDSGRDVAVLVGHTQGLYAVEWSRYGGTGHILGTVSSDQTCRLWNAQTGECVQVLEGHVEEVNGLSFSTNSQLLATASDDKTAMVWDINTATPVTLFQGHGAIVYGVCFQPNAPILATASFDWTSKVWDTRTGTDVQTLTGHNEDVIGVDIDGSGFLLATGSDDQTCRIWDLRMGQMLEVLRDHSGEVKRVKFSPYGSLLATTSGDATVRIFNMSNLECEQVLRSHRDHVFDADWAPNMNFLASAGHDRMWKIWRPVLSQD